MKSLAFDQSGTYLAVAGTDLRVYLCKQWQELKVFGGKYSERVKVCVHVYPQSKNTVCALHSEYLLLLWQISEEISRRSMLFHIEREYIRYQTCVHTTFYRGSGLTRTLMFNGSILYVLSLHMLHFSSVGHM